MIKRFVSATLSLIMTTGIIQTLPANALEMDEPYPYTLFAGSEADGAITINADNVCINGSIAANGSIVSTAANFNVNGQRHEHAQQEMIYVFGKLDRAYFDSSNVLTVDTDYTVEDVNISLNEPVVSLSSISLNGNVNLNTQLKAEQDIQVIGNSCNANNAALISHYGDIYIDSENFGYSGLIYAPNGDIVIESSSTNLNNVIVIGQTITIECPNLNVNYNTNAANVIGTISEDPDDPDEDDYLYAVGSYNEKNNAIDISWSGNHLPDSVDIMVSADGENYTLAATATDTSVYAYPVGDDFISAYFKVSYMGTNGNTVESLPFQASATENGIVIDYPDSDGDSISDIMESILKTDPSKTDTDDDGLTDPQELYITDTDPTVFDSVEPLVSDADADSDADGISNINEIELGTDPQNPDTDDDRLTDSEEVTVYLTDPQLEDTDGDTLNDGFEIRYGLDPLSPYTDGISDAERQIEQHIDADNPLMDIVNTEDSPYEISVQITMHGDAERELSVLESGYSVSLENDAQIGAITDVILPDSCEPEALRLTYAIKDAYRSNTLNKYTRFEDMQGIKRLCVFRYYDEIGMMLPLETQYDLDNNTVYADVNAAGTYSVMDLERWFDIFGVDPDQVQIDEATQNTANNPPFLNLPHHANTLAPASEPNNTPISIYIMLPCTGHNETLFHQQVAELEDFGSEILVKYPEAKITVFTVSNTFSGDTTYVNTTSTTYKAVNLDYRKRLHLNPIEYNLISNQKSVVTSSLYNGVKNGLIDDGSQYKFVYDFQNGNIVVDDRDNALNLCENYNSCHYSRICSEDYDYFRGRFNNYTLIDDYSERVHQAILDCGGIDLTNMDTVAEDMAAHIWETVGDTTTYEALLANRLKYVSLDARLSPDNQTDTDEDTLTDWQEADNTHITVNADGTVTLPTVQYLISRANIDINQILNFAGNISAARDAMFRSVLSRQVLPCNSDPTEKDSDGDDLTDDEEDNLETRIMYADSDCDGLSDGYEVELWFDPKNANPDGDTYNDKEELQNGTSSYAYNKTAEESAFAFLRGAFMGDFETPESIEALFGQVAVSFVPMAADARDYFANIIVNQNTEAAILNVFGFVMDFIPIAGSAEDVAKVLPKLSRFIIRYADDVPKVMEAILQVAKQFPHSDDIVLGVARILPVGAVDDICDSLKRGSKLTGNDYAKLIDICEAAGKNADEVVECTKFHSFKALKRYLGDPGVDNLGHKKQWHHIVEQCQAKARRSGFDVSDINQVSNIMATPKEVHKDISKYYSRIDDFTGGKTVRDWLNGKSFEFQYEFGIEQWKKYMTMHGYSVD